MMVGGFLIGLPIFIWGVVMVVRTYSNHHDTNESETTTRLFDRNQPAFDIDIAANKVVEDISDDQWKTLHSRRKTLLGKGESELVDSDQWDKELDSFVSSFCIARFSANCRAEFNRLRREARSNGYDPTSTEKEIIGIVDTMKTSFKEYVDESLEANEEYYDDYDGG